MLAYVAFRKAIITEDLAESSCLVGTMAQETYMTFPSIRDACGASMFDHASTLEADMNWPAVSAVLRMIGLPKVWLDTRRLLSKEDSSLRKQGMTRSWRAKVLLIWSGIFGFCFALPRTRRERDRSERNRAHVLPA
ncbi:hypothetical protein AJ87_47265 [Rhizobium yanglingense]|nr:hypothetical protein AJ87_47265 [Rhizobium yanglingense]